MEVVKNAPEEYSIISTLVIIEMDYGHTSVITPRIFLSLSSHSSNFSPLNN